MERYNPFASDQFASDSADSSTSRRTTSFPDPLARVESAPSSGRSDGLPFPDPSPRAPQPQAAAQPQPRAPAASPLNSRSNSLAFMNRTLGERGDDETDGYERDGGRTSRSASRSSERAGSFKQARSTASGAAGGGTLSSFLSRATSVTSNSVSDRMSGAAASVRSAVDSISSQLQQAVPVGQFNERLASSVNYQSPAGSTGAPTGSPTDARPLSLGLGGSAGGGGTSLGLAASAPQMPLISRQRVVLVLDSGPTAGGLDWPLQFLQYRRAMAGLAPAAAPSSSSSSLTSFFSAQFSSSSANADAALATGSDLIEQAKSAEISVFANQSSSTAAVWTGAASNQQQATSSGSVRQSQQQPQPGGGSGRIIRPEYVVVRQRAHKFAKDHLEDLVKAFDYCAVPLFEPYDIWHTFQDKQLIFAKLLRVQKSLGKENFPLIPQVYCQTHQDLLNYINNNNSQLVQLPCLVRTAGASGGRMRFDSIEMLRSFATIMAAQQLSCTVEQSLDIKCDLIVQRLGSSSLKLFKKYAVAEQQPQQQQQQQQQPQLQQHQQNGNQSSGAKDRLQQSDESLNSKTSQLANLSGQARQSATRQTSLGAGVLSSLISSAGQQVSRRSSQPQTVPPGLLSPAAQYGAQFERVNTEVSARYKNWVEAISREFGHRLDCFAIKIIVASNDREYVVGLRDCSMEFLGSPENQEEDRRTFVELILNKMNAILPKHILASRQSSASLADQRQARESGLAENEDKHLQTMRTADELFDKKSAELRASNQTDVTVIGRSYGQLNNRSKSVSINQGDSFGSLTFSSASEKPANLTPGAGQKSRTIFPAPLNRRSSDQASEALGPTTGGSPSVGAGSANYQRQISLGQSLIDQTSTALSSIQRQSLSFFKRLDATGQSRASEASSSPPESASLASDSFAFGASSSATIASTPGALNELETLAESGRQRALTGAGVKSQSVDYSCLPAGSPRLAGSTGRRLGAPPPPPPPPPLAQSLMNRQSSLASTGSRQHGKFADETGTPNTTPVRSRQNTATSDTCSQFNSMGLVGPNRSQNTQKVLRQNSALSAFEPFDSELRSSEKSTSASQLSEKFCTGGATGDRVSNVERANGGELTVGSSSSSYQPAKKRGSQTFDSGSVKSTDSNGTTGNDSTGTAEDTMNNLKKTFASIFGDKCE